MGNYISTIPGGDPIELVVYRPEENRFYDVFGRLLYNIFEMITPNDLLTFRDDPGNTMFRHREKVRTFVEIVEEECHSSYFPHELLLIQEKRKEGL